MFHQSVRYKIPWVNQGSISTLQSSTKIVLSICSALQYDGSSVTIVCEQTIPNEKVFLGYSLHAGYVTTVADTILMADTILSTELFGVR